MNNSPELVYVRDMLRYLWGDDRIEPSEEFVEIFTAPFRGDYKRLVKVLSRACYVEQDLNGQ